MNVSCPLCSSQSQPTNVIVGHNLSVLECEVCRLEFLDLRLSEGQMQELYSKDYYKAWWADNKNVEAAIRRMKRATFAKSLEKVKSFVSQGKVLDLGCATGFSLEEADERGFETYRIEISEFAALAAKRKFGENNIFHGTLESAPF